MHRASQAGTGKLHALLVLLGRLGSDAVLAGALGTRRGALLRRTFVLALEMPVASDAVLLPVHAQLNQLGKHLAEVVKEEVPVLGILRRSGG